MSRRNWFIIAGVTAYIYVGMTITLVVVIR